MAFKNGILKPLGPKASDELVGFCCPCIQDSQDVGTLTLIDPEKSRMKLAGQTLVPLEGVVAKALQYRSTLAKRALTSTFSLTPKPTTSLNPVVLALPGIWFSKDTAALPVSMTCALGSKPVPVYPPALSMLMSACAVLMGNSAMKRFTSEPTTKVTCAEDPASLALHGVMKRACSSTP